VMVANIQTTKEITTSGQRETLRSLLSRSLILQSRNSAFSSHMFTLTPHRYGLQLELPLLLFCFGAIGSRLQFS
jgi:hypothetical protein